MRGSGMPMRGGGASGGRPRRWGARAAAGDDIDYGGAPSYSAGPNAPAATKSPPYPLPRQEPRRRREPWAGIPGILRGVTTRKEEPYPDEDDAEAAYAEPQEDLYESFEPAVPLGVGPGALGIGARHGRAEEGVRFTLNALAIGVVIFILAVPIAVGLARYGIVIPSAPQEAPSHLVPTPMVATGYTGYQNALFSLAYPSTWLHTPGTGQFHSGTSLTIESFWDGGQQEVAVITTSAIPADQVPSLFTEALGKAGAVSAHQVTSGLAPSYDGATWSGAEYTATLTINSQHAAIQARVLAATSGATTYFIVLIAPQARFTRADTQTFEPVLQSFRFQ